MPNTLRGSHRTQYNPLVKGRAPVTSEHSEGGIRVRESEIEDALVVNLSLLQKLLGLDSEPRLVARQLRMRSGEQRLDLLLLHKDELLLVELKVTAFSPNYLDQIVAYLHELRELQVSGDLITGAIKPYLLVTDASESDLRSCAERGVALIAYEPLEVLERYFASLSELTPFFRVKPKDYGVYNLALMNRTLSKIREGIIDKSSIAEATRLGRSSVHHHLKLAAEFGLVRRERNKYWLTDFGHEYLGAMGSLPVADVLSQQQAELLSNFIAKDPFYSPTVFGVYAIVESAFLLSRNAYPLEFEDLIGMFTTLAGKETEWKAPRTRTTATYTFLNFAVDLGLLGKIGQRIVLTPAGFRFIIALQLHKSIRMIESVYIGGRMDQQAPGT